MRSRDAMVVVATPDYFASAEVFLESAGDHFTGADQFILEVPTDRPARTPRDSTAAPLSLDSVLRDPSLVRALTSRYDPFELCCALKPFALQALLERGYERAFYFDTDMKLFGDPDEFRGSLDEVDFSVAPHILDPSVSKPKNEVTFLQQGVFNAGAIGVSQSGSDFLNWWAGRVTVLGQNEPSEGVFVDQKWLDMAFVHFAGYIVRDPGFNVGPWNLSERILSRGNRGWTVGGESTLKLFHFSKVSPRHVDPAYAQRGNTEVMGLVAEYQRELVSHGWSARAALPGRFQEASRRLRDDAKRRASLRSGLSDAIRTGDRGAESSPGLSPRDRIAAFAAPRGLRRDWLRYGRLR